MNTSYMSCLLLRLKDGGHCIEQMLVESAVLPPGFKKLTSAGITQVPLELQQFSLRLHICSGQVMSFKRGNAETLQVKH